EFAAVQRSDARIEVSEASPPKTIEIPDKVVNVCNFYSMLDLQAVRHADGTIRVDSRSRLITNEFEDAEIDPDVLCQQINQHLPDAGAHIDDVGQYPPRWDAVVCCVAVSYVSGDPGCMDRIYLIYPFMEPCDSWTLYSIWDGGRS